MSDWLEIRTGILEEIGIEQGLDDVITEPSITDGIIFVDYDDSYRAITSVHTSIDDDLVVLFGSDPLYNLKLEGIIVDLIVGEAVQSGKAYSDLDSFINTHSVSGYNSLPTGVSVKIGNTDIDGEFYLHSGRVGKRMSLPDIFPVFPFSLNFIKKPG